MVEDNYNPEDKEAGKEYCQAMIDDEIMAVGLKHALRSAKYGIKVMDAASKQKINGEPIEFSPYLHGCREVLTDFIKRHAKTRKKK
jgi:hypothetical protein